jgi:hypothetical protein
MVNIVRTYYFEIINPQNKSVLNYGSKEDIFLLAKIHTATGTEALFTDRKVVMCVHNNG